MPDTGHVGFDKVINTICTVNTEQYDSIRLRLRRRRSQIFANHIFLDQSSKRKVFSKLK